MNPAAKRLERQGDATSNLWAITSYYNPCDYSTRLDNFRTFRRYLGVPLVAVELAHDGKCDLNDGDAEVLIQVQHGAVLWQKERLLNIALQAIPPHVQYVAWIDCDMIFERTDWAEAARTELMSSTITQLFACGYYLGQNDSLDIVRPAGDAECTAIAHTIKMDPAAVHDFRPGTHHGAQRRLFGGGWAARRDLLERHGFYDALILGSGDRALACAAVGRFNDAASTACLDAVRTTHYLRWAAPFAREVSGRVGCIEGVILHLWHGEIGNRMYLPRHQGLSHYAFDPYNDISLNDEGAWEWATPRPELHEFVRNYFIRRREDG
jgi:hypothetical protein